MGAVEGNNQAHKKKSTRSAQLLTTQADSACWVHISASYKMRWPILRNWIALTQGYLYAKFQSSTVKLEYFRGFLKCSPTANARRRRACATPTASARRRRVRAVLELQFWPKRRLDYQIRRLGQKVCFPGGTTTHSRWPVAAIRVVQKFANWLQIFF